jgi:hypothetical protein
MRFNFFHSILGEGRDFVVVGGPFGHDSPGRVQLGLLGERVVAEINVLGLVLSSLSAPRLAVEPFLRQAEDGHLEFNWMLLAVSR